MHIPNRLLQFPSCCTKLLLSLLYHCYCYSIPTPLPYHTNHTIAALPGPPPKMFDASIRANGEYGLLLSYTTDIYAVFPRIVLDLTYHPVCPALLLSCHHLFSASPTRKSYLRTVRPLHRHHPLMHYRNSLWPLRTGQITT